MTKTEDDQNGRRLKRKMTKGKMTKMEDDQKGKVQNTINTEIVIVI